MSSSEKRTLNDMLLSSKETMDNYAQILAKSVGRSTASAQRFFLKKGNAPPPSLSEVTQMMLHCPSMARLLESNGFLTPASSPGRLEMLGTLPLEEMPKKKKKKNKNKNKKKNGENAEAPLNTGGGVLRPRNFLEAALYFSTIKMSTVEMATELDPEHFFAPPLLFRGSEGTAAWLDSFRREKGNISVLEFEQHKAMQKRTTGLFAVALLQTAQHLKPSTSSTTAGSVSVRSNYMKRTIGLYAISLVDHLPSTLHINSHDRPTHSIANLPKSFLRSNPILSNRKLELNDLKVPSPQQLSDYWASLKDTEKISILRTEQNALQKGWMNPKKTWCLCKYCRTRALRLGDVYELLYRAYFDDLERVALEIENKPALNDGLKGKTRKHLFKSLSILADDVMDERGSYLTMVLKRLGKAFEDDCEWENGEDASTKPCEEVCENCSRHQPKSTEDGFPDEMDDSADEHKDVLSDSWDEEDLESFYEDFNMIEDEEIIQAECELAIDPAHLPTSFPTLYDPRMYSMPRPTIPAYSLHSDQDRINDGLALYESLAGLLFQFHLVPRYLEAEALSRQRRLLEEEEERERAEYEKAQQKQAAKQRKKEKQRAAKKKLKEQAELEVQIEQDDETRQEDNVEKAEEMEEVEEEEEVEIEVEVEEAEEVEEEMVLVSEKDYTEQPDNEPLTVASDQKIESSGSSSRSSSESFSKYSDDDAPPGLSTSPPPPKELTGEAPPSIPPTWFDKILNGSNPVALWSPLATRQKEDLPPGFAPPVWSPFMH